MNHKSKLLKNEFNLIASGLKIIEIRLFDEKRSKFNIGDKIEFTKLPKKIEKVEAEITALLRYKSFADLVDDFDLKNYGYTNEYTCKEFIDSMYTIYSKESEKKYGVVGIKLKLLK